MNIDLHYFAQLNISLNNLVELHLNDFRDDYYKNDSDIEQTGKLTFPNLKKFYFKFYRYVNFTLIKKLKFEQLEIAEIYYDLYYDLYCDLHYDLYYDPIFCTRPYYYVLDIHFFNQFKSTKVLHCTRFRGRS